MLVWCTVCLGSVMCGRVVYCVVRRCTVCYGGLPCGKAVYCILWWSTVC